MKASELRIGNFYSQFGNVHETSCFTIETLTKASKQQLWCKPIPITEEWLLKFGFEGWDLDIYTMNLITNNFCILFDELEIVAKNIKYVHQLQNLYFALTNEELIIKL